MHLKNYQKTSSKVWTGRIDDPLDLDSYRMHQIIKPIDLTTIDSFKIERFSICFLGFCCDEGILRNLGRPGAKKGPEYIRKEFANLPVTFGDKLSIYDAGDIHCVENDLEDAQYQLGIAVKTLLALKLFPILLGGGHEIVLGHFYGINKHLKTSNEKLGIINFDAHLDLRPYNEGGSSGTMFAQIADICNNQNHNLSYLCVGAQTYSNTISLFKRADFLGAKYILAKNLIPENTKENYSIINEFITANDHIYVTLDCDVFSSAFAPGVSAMQPFGLDPETVLTLLKQILKSGKVISFDVAEVSPRFDQDNHTAKLIAVIIYALINTLVD
ncbi:MAG: formimidoylglutamase [Salinivirgaceae bacterium]|nr:formimidoylglutamase [Salinivirgaceae bacterium]